MNGHAWHTSRPPRSHRTYVVVGVAAVLLVTGIWWLWPMPATSVKCPKRTAAQNAERADLIMIGSVVIVLPGDPYAQVMVHPDKTYKGSPSNAVKIFAQPSNLNATSNDVINGDLHFASTQPPYLLFLQKSGDGYTTSKCDGSRSLGSGLTADEKAALE